VATRLTKHSNRGIPSLLEKWERSPKGERRRVVGQFGRHRPLAAKAVEIERLNRSGEPLRHPKAKGQGKILRG
jgi:hypothetical protein